MFICSEQFGNNRSCCFLDFVFCCPAILRLLQHRQHGCHDLSRPLHNVVLHTAKPEGYEFSFFGLHPSFRFNSHANHFVNDGLICLLRFIYSDMRNDLDSLVIGSVRYGFQHCGGIGKLVLFFIQFYGRFRQQPTLTLIVGSQFCIPLFQLGDLFPLRLNDVIIFSRLSLPP